MIKEIKDGVYLLRHFKDKDTLFEGCWPIKDGVSINSYLIVGSKMKAVIDYTEHGSSFDEELRSVGVKIEDVDALILNHMEPDHTGGLGEVFRRNPNIKVYCTKVSSTEVLALYGYANCIPVKDGDEIDLGGRVLSFYSAPNVHWPDTMVTYSKDDGLLFSCDAFGSFGEYAHVYDDELDDKEKALLKTETERYYANIVSSFSRFVLAAIKKLSALDIRMILPSHGIIWRKNPGHVVSWYERLASYAEGPREKEVAIIYASMYGNTLPYVEILKEIAKREGIPVHLVRIPDEHVSYALEKAWRSEAIVVAAPTYEMALFPEMAAALDIFARKGIKKRKAMYFGSSLWSGGAAKEFKAIAERMELDVVDAIEFRGRGNEGDREKIISAFKTLLEGIK